MTKRNVTSTLPSDRFSDLTIRGQPNYVAFPASMAKEIEQMTRDANSPARTVLNKIASLKVGDRPHGKELGSGIYYMTAGRSGKDTMGFAYLPPDRQKDMPATILTTMTYGDYAEMLRKKSLQTALKAQVTELRQSFDDRKPETDTAPKRILKTQKIYSVATGMMG